MLFVVWLGILSSTAAAEARTWTDDTGRYQLDAEFIGIVGNKVRLQAPTGKTYSIALASLSPADRQVVLLREQAAQTLTSESQAIAQAAGQPTAPGGLPPVDSMFKNPAPLELPPLGQSPASQAGQLPGGGPLPPGAEPGGQTDNAAAGQSQQSATNKDKRIFSGCRSTFHLDSRLGTGAYWLEGKHYLARLEFLHTQGDYVYFTGSGEGGIKYWAFFDVERCGPSRVYAWSNNGNRWRLYDWDYRELPD